MAYNDKELKRDVRNIPIPQYWDEDANDYAPLDNGMNIKEAQVMLPFEKQATYIDTKQTHTGVTIAASGYSDGAWLPVNGAESIKLIISVDSSFTYTAVIQWSFDGSTFSGEEPVTLLNGNKSKNASGRIDVAAPYFRVSLTNGHTASHVFNAWAALRA